MLLRRAKSLKPKAKSKIQVVWAELKGGEGRTPVRPFAQRANIFFGGRAPARASLRGNQIERKSPKPSVAVVLQKRVGGAFEIWQRGKKSGILT